MTRDEAKSILFDMLGNTTIIEPTEQNQAILTAIKALEQESCEDCVSRQAVLDAIAANCVWENEYNLTSSRIKKAVEDLPPVTPQLDELKALKEKVKTMREDKGVLEQLAEEQNSLLSTVKAWSDVIEKNGYVN